MIDAGALAAIAAAFFVVAVTPGPANLACASVAMARGRAAGLRFGAGLSLGLAVWGVLAATGMGAVLQASGWVLAVLKVVGGLYLLWLAWGAGRSALRDGHAPQVEAGMGRRAFWQGLALNLTNPKAVLAWMAALAVGLDPADGAAMVVTATLICAGLGVVNYLGWALVFSTGRMMAGYLRARRWIDGAASALFAAAGLGLLRQALARAPG